MYTGAIIALSVDPTSRRDYLSGQKEMLNSSANGDAPITDHPYYGLFFFDLFIM